MGCDIHMYSESYNKETHEWESIDKWQTNPYYEEGVADGGRPLEVRYHDRIYASRDYWLFGTLCAGVRAEFKFSLQERGLPRDVSKPIKEDSDAWASDGHSHSYITKNELAKLSTKLLLINSHEGNYVNSIIQDIISKLPDGNPDHHRIVFWFDN